MIVFARHGQTAPNRDGLVLGRADPDLTEEGHRQAELLAAALATEPVKAIVTSPLVRARQTADAIATACGVPVRVDDRLMEIDWGAWEGRPGRLLDAQLGGDLPLLGLDGGQQGLHGGDGVGQRRFQGRDLGIELLPLDEHLELLVFAILRLAPQHVDVGLHGLELLRRAHGARVHLGVDRLGLGLQAADLVVETFLLPEHGVAPLRDLQPLALERGVGRPAGLELGPFGQGGQPVPQAVGRAVVVLQRQEVVEGAH